jgi:hypothetical protein
MQAGTLGLGSLRLVLFVVSCYSCFAQSTPSAKQLPKTVDEAVSILKSEISPTLRESMVRIPREDAQAELHFSVGMGIRNRFKLWSGNADLMKSCGVMHPDDCSGIIIGRLWDAVRAEADPALVRKLDCQFSLVQAIHINYQGFDRLTTGQLLQSMGLQINEQIANLTGNGTPLCQSSLALHVTGDPNPDCFVRAEFAHEGKKREVPLELLFGWIGWRNDFDAVNEPPAINLKFRKRCAWVERPRF